MGGAEQGRESRKKVVRPGKLREECGRGDQALSADGHREDDGGAQKEPWASPMTSKLAMHGYDHYQGKERGRDAVHHSRVEHVGEREACRHNSPNRLPPSPTGVSRLHATQGISANG